MADALMLYETIDAGQIDEIMAGKTPSEPSDWGSNDSGASSDDENSSEAANDAKPTGPIGGPAGEH
jgi:cell division protease FtsH